MLTKTYVKKYPVGVVCAVCKVLVGGSIAWQSNGLNYCAMKCVIAGCPEYNPISRSKKSAINRVFDSAHRIVSTGTDGVVAEMRVEHWRAEFWRDKTLKLCRISPDLYRLWRGEDSCDIHMRPAAPVLALHPEKGDKSRDNYAQVAVWNYATQVCQPAVKLISADMAATLAKWLSRTLRGDSQEVLPVMLKAQVVTITFIFADDRFMVWVERASEGTRLQARIFAAARVANLWAGATIGLVEDDKASFLA